VVAHGGPGVPSVGDQLGQAFRRPGEIQPAGQRGRRSTRRDVDRDGGTRRPRRSVRAPSAASTSAGTSDAHSLIAVTESAPASTAAAANTITTAAWCRIPGPAPRLGNLRQAVQQVPVTAQVTPGIAAGIGHGGQGRYGILARQRGSRGRNGIFRQIRSYRELVARSRAARRSSRIVTRPLRPASSQHPRRPQPCPANPGSHDHTAPATA
jgi:hypothetical protein